MSAQHPETPRWLQYAITTVAKSRRSDESYLRPRSILLYLLLAECGTWGPYPSEGLLSSVLGITRAAVLKARDHLQDAGLIKFTHSLKNNGSEYYTLHIDYHRSILVTQTEPTTPSSVEPIRRMQHAIMTAVEGKRTDNRSLRSTAILLYLLLAECGTTGSYPSVGVLVNVLGVDFVSISKAEDDLVDAGLLKFAPSSEPASEKTYSLYIAYDRNANMVQMLARLTKHASTAGVVTSEQSKPEGALPSGTSLPEPAPGAAPTPIAPPAPPSPKKVKLTPEVAAWFLENPDRMDLYLRFGTAAYLKTPEEAALRPSQATDWLVFKPADLRFPFDTKWTHNHHMGYYWQGVCRWRAKWNIPLTFPHWGRLAGDLKNLLATTTPWQAHCHIYSAISHFDLMRFRLGKIGENMVLDETTLSHKLIREQMLLIASHGQEWTDAEYQRMHTALTNPTSFTTGGEYLV